MNIGRLEQVATRFVKGMGGNVGNKVIFVAITWLYSMLHNFLMQQAMHVKLLILIKDIS